MLNKFRPRKQLQEVARWTLGVIVGMFAILAFFFVLVNFPNVVTMIFMGTAIVCGGGLLWAALIPARKD